MPSDAARRRTAARQQQLARPDHPPLQHLLPRGGRVGLDRVPSRDVRTQGGGLEIFGAIRNARMG